MINWRRIRRKEHDKKRCNMVYQKALLWKIHDAGILSVEGVMGMDLIDKHNAIDVVNDAIAEYIPLQDGWCIMNLKTSHLKATLDQTRGDSVE